MHYNTKIIKEKLLISDNEAVKISNLEYDFKIMMFKYMTNIERRIKAAVVRLFNEYLNVTAVHKMTTASFYHHKVDDLNAYLGKATHQIKTRLQKENLTIEDYIYNIPFSEVYNFIESFKEEYIKFIKKQFNYNKLSVLKFKIIIHKLVKTRNIICHNAVILHLPGLAQNWFSGDYLLNEAYKFLTPNLYRMLKHDLVHLIDKHHHTYRQMRIKFAKLKFLS